MSTQLSIPDIVRPVMFAGHVESHGPGSRYDTWGGEPVASFGCRFADLFELLPVFRRVPLTAGMADDARRAPDAERAPEWAPPGAIPRSAPNPYLDVIVREPDLFVPDPIPVGVVSKRYRVVQHRDALRAVGDALARRRISPDALPVDVTITGLGGRLACSIRLPGQFDFEEADGTRVTLTIECFNSVDRTASFRVVVGWFRFVCANGLFVGNTRVDFRRTHTPSLRIADLDAALAGGIDASDRDRARWKRWQQLQVPGDALVIWAESTVASAWGPLAAARVLHIARTGLDARVATRSFTGPLSRRPMRPTVRVPGSSLGARSVYDVAQILSWLAGQTREIDSRAQRRSEVPRLMAPVVRTARRGPVRPGSEHDLARV